MKRLWIAAVLLLILAAGGWAYLTYAAPSPSSQSAASSSAAAESPDALAEEPESVIWASGKLQPVLWANLAPPQGGVVERLAVRAGDWVEPGQLLVQLDNPTASSRAEVAAAAVAAAEAAHAALLAGAGRAEIAAAEAALAGARAQLSIASGRLLEAQESVEASAVDVLIAQGAFDELASGPTSAERSAAAARVEVAQAALDHAQAAYNVVLGDPGIGSTRLEALQLQQAIKSLEAAKAEFDVATQGATEQQMAVARARISEARSRVAVAESRVPAAEAGVESAAAALASAQASLRRLQEGASPEEIAVSAAHLQTAGAQLASALAVVDQGRVLAPFAGQVGAVRVRIGEQVSAGLPLVLLGDTNNMHVETTDLRETDVLRLQLRQDVEVTFDALPDRIFAGVVTHIAPVSASDKGSTNYTVHVELADLDDGLRWGMTAFVNATIAAKR